MLDRQSVQRCTRTDIPKYTHNRNLLLLTLIMGMALVGCARHMPGSITLIVRSGAVTITHGVDGKTESLNNGQEAMLTLQDSIAATGSGSLYLPQAAIAFASGTQFTLSRYELSNDQLLVTLDIKAGQLDATFNALTTASQYTFSTPHATISPGNAPSTNSGELITWVTDTDTRVGVISGSAIVTGQAQPVTLHDGDGTRIAAGKAPDKPAPWNQVSVPLYHPNLTPLVLPVTLTNLASGLTYKFNSDQLSMVPNGDYSLLIDDSSLLQPYKVDKITLPIQDQKSLNELPITFGQVAFRAADAKVLIIQSADGKTRTITAGDKLLIGPGTQTFILARQDRPASSQPVDLNLLPGQTKTVDLDNNLFGASQIQVKVTGPDGQVMPVQVYIFQASNETGQPLQKFTSDKTSGILPEDKYVVIIPLQVNIPIAVRLEAEIGQGQVKVAQNPVTALEVKMGTLSLVYPRPGVILLIAQADKMQQSQVPIDLKSILDARSSSPTRDYIAAIKASGSGRTQIALPEGQYAVVIDGQKDYKLEGIKVSAGTTTSVTLTP